MTVAELILALQTLPHDYVVVDDEGRSVARVKDDATLVMDRSEDD
jgi:hypothetical protein